MEANQIRRIPLENFNDDGNRLLLLFNCNRCNTIPTNYAIKTCTTDEDCGNYCQICLEENNNKCCNCSSDDSLETLFPNLKKQLKNLKMKCINDPCEYEMKYAELEEHLKSCNYSKMKCNDCQTDWYLKDYQIHRNHCNHSIINCTQCTYYSKRLKQVHCCNTVNHLNKE